MAANDRDFLRHAMPFLNEMLHPLLEFLQTLTRRLLIQVRIDVDVVAINRCDWRQRLLTALFGARNKPKTFGLLKAG